MWTKPAYAVSSVLLLIAAFGLDVLTPAAWVVSILFNIPIALSGLVMRRSFTFGVVALAVLLNITAGYLNGQGALEPDSSALLNRALSTLSFVLVGFMTLQLRSSGARAARAALEESRALRERNLRQLLTRLSQASSPETLLDEASAGLRDYLGASAVVIVGLERGRYAPPRFAAPPGSSLAQTGAPAPDYGATLEAVWSRGEGQEFRILVEGASGQRDALEDAVGAVAPVYEQRVLRGQLEAESRELERSSDLIRDLIYAFSHDLRTPLLASSMNMKLALQGVYGPLSPEYQASLHNGLESNTALLSLAEQLLTVAKLEAGEVSPDLRPLDLSAMLSERIQALSQLASASRLEVSTALEPDLWVRGDRGELGRVVQNLLENAYKWSPPGETVTVQLERRGHYAQITVQDRGPGVPEALRGTLFQRFRKAGAGAGSGLGLYLARRIVEGHGGRIAYARAEGQSQFRFSLPLLGERGPLEAQRPRSATL